MVWVADQGSAQGRYQLSLALEAGDLFRARLLVDVIFDPIMLIPHSAPKRTNQNKRLHRIIPLVHDVERWVARSERSRSLCTEYKISLCRLLIMCVAILRLHHEF